jgi:hypothetical protein
VTTDSADGELRDRVERWVETSGFALELRVARAITLAGEHGASVNLSVPYFDNQSQKWREADVVASVRDRQHPDVMVQLVVECKSSKEKPWVIFTDRRRYIGDDEAYSRQIKSGGRAERVRHVWANARGSIPWPTTGAGYSIAEALRQKATGEEDTQNVPYRAVRQVVNAAINLRPQIKFHAGDFVLLTLPVVVTGARLFECALDDVGNVSVLEATGMTVYVKPDLHPDHPYFSQDPAGGRAAVLVHVVQEDYFRDTWLPDLVRVLAAMADR